MIECHLCGRRFTPWPGADQATCPNCGAHIHPPKRLDELAKRRAEKATLKAWGHK